MEKFYSSKTLLKMAGGRSIHSIPHIPRWIRPWLHNNNRWPQILETCFKQKIPKAVKARLL